MSVFYTVRCDIGPRQEEELDRFLSEQVKPFLLAQPEVKNFRVFSDALVGWPERTLMIEVDDLASLERVLQSPEQAAPGRIHEIRDHCSKSDSGATGLATGAAAAQVLERDPGYAIPSLHFYRECGHASKKPMNPAFTLDGGAT
ncbi:MAG: hypothetical protein ACKVVP_03915 [Chloroflexota bacterium]